MQPEPAVYTVPTARMRQGDFGEFTTQIFDPFTATGTNATRTAFNNNVIPSGRINPVAAAYVAMYPEPNRPGTASNFATNGLRPYNYNAGMGRIDHNISASSRLYATVYFNKRQEDRYNWAQDAPNAPGGVINGFAVTRGFDYRSNVGFTGGYTYVISPSTVLDFRASGTRFGEYRDPAQTFDPAKLGFSQTAVQLMGGYQYLPLFTIGSFSTTNANSTIASLGSQRSDWNQGFNRPMWTTSIAPTLTKIWSDHSVRMGYDYRAQTLDDREPGVPRRTLRVQRRVHARQQRGRAERSRAVVRAAAAGAPDGRDSRRRVGRRRGQPVRDRLARQVPAVLSRPVRAGRLARSAAG